MNDMLFIRDFVNFVMCPVVPGVNRNICGLTLSSMTTETRCLSSIYHLGYNT